VGGDQKRRLTESTVSGNGEGTGQVKGVQGAGNEGTCRGDWKEIRRVLLRSGGEKSSNSRRNKRDAHLENIR